MPWQHCCPFSYGHNCESLSHSTAYSRHAPAAGAHRQLVGTSATRATLWQTGMGTLSLFLFKKAWTPASRGLILTGCKSARHNKTVRASKIIQLQLKQGNCPQAQPYHWHSWMSSTLVPQKAVSLSSQKLAQCSNQFIAGQLSQAPAQTTPRHLQDFSARQPEPNLKGSRCSGEERRGPRIGVALLGVALLAARLVTAEVGRVVIHTPPPVSDVEGHIVVRVRLCTVNKLLNGGAQTLAVAQADNKDSLLMCFP